ncbi:hypothetical protein G3N59_15415 [Paraburkholderia sp. Ac-20340]|nr:hypothetical protein [Paraburkholderia sp. Ac-20340]
MLEEPVMTSPPWSVSSSTRSRLINFQLFENDSVLFVAEIQNAKVRQLVLAACLPGRLAQIDILDVGPTKSLNTVSAIFTKPMNFREMRNAISPEISSQKASPGTMANLRISALMKN